MLGLVEGHALRQRASSNCNVSSMLHDRIRNLRGELDTDTMHSRQPVFCECFDAKQAEPR